MKTILCYGDSNTFGYNPTDGGRYAYDKRWTTILGKLLGNEYLVIPEGLNGRTTAFDRPGSFFQNGYPYLAPCLTSHKPLDTVVIMLGTNDCNVDLGLSAEDIAAGMEKLVLEVKNVAPDVQGFIPKMIIVVPGAIGENYMNSPFAYQLDESSCKKSRDIAPLYKALADKYGCLYLDGSEILETSEYDSEHLTVKGHEKLAELLDEIIRTI